MRTIIAGGRDFTDLALASKYLDALDPQPTVVLNGCARGADTLGAFWASSRHIPIEPYPANWTLYGKGAGFRRNTEMAASADRLVAFWNRHSKGTAHMIDTANKMGLVVEVIHVS